MPFNQSFCIQTNPVVADFELALFEQTPVLLFEKLDGFIHLI